MARPKRDRAGERRRAEATYDAWRTRWTDFFEGLSADQAKQLASLFADDIESEFEFLALAEEKPKPTSKDST